MFANVIKFSFAPILSPISLSLSLSFCRLLSLPPSSKWEKQSRENVKEGNFVWIYGNSIEYKDNT